MIRLCCVSFSNPKHFDTKSMEISAWRTVGSIDIKSEFIFEFFFVFLCACYATLSTCICVYCWGDACAHEWANVMSVRGFWCAKLSYNILINYKTYSNNRKKSPKNQFTIRLFFLSCIVWERRDIFFHSSSFYIVDFFGFGFYSSVET